MARWRSGNAGVCKTFMQGFESPPRLNMNTEHFLGQIFGVEVVTITTVLGIESTGTVIPGFVAAGIVGSINATVEFYKQREINKVKDVAKK